MANTKVLVVDAIYNFVADKFFFIEVVQSSILDAHLKFSGFDIQFLNNLR